MIGNSPLAFVFPGVGVAPCGAEPLFLAEQRPAVAPFLAEGSQWAGVDLAAAVEGERLSELSPRGWQLFTYAFSCAAAHVYRAKGARPSWVAGYSLGLYAALWAAGCVSYAEGLSLVARAYDLMTEAARGKGPFAMGVIVGLGRGEWDRVLAPRESLRVANVNSDISVVFGGLAAEVEGALAEALARGASKARLLPADAPVHHPVLAEASRAFRVHLEGLTWRAPRCPVVCSIDQALLEDPAALKDFTAVNLSTPIHWQKVTEKLASLGAQWVLECGHGVSLTQNARFIPGAVRHVNVRNWHRAFLP